MSKENPIGGVDYLMLWLTPTLELAGQVIDKYKRKLQDNPDDKDACVLIGLSYSTLGDFEKSKLYLEKAYDYFADGYDLESYVRFLYHYVSGLVAFKNRDYKLAEIEFKKAIELLASLSFNRENNEFIGLLEGMIKWFPFDETFEEMIQADSFKKMLFKAEMLKKSVEGMRIWQNETFLPVMLRGCCLYYIYNVLTFSKVDMGMLDRLEGCAQNYKWHDSAVLIRNIEKFALEIKHYKSLDEIPEEQEKRVIGLLRPAKAIAGELTYESLRYIFENLSKQISSTKSEISQSTEQPVESQKADEERREFLNECSLIIRVPATYYLKGSSFTNEATIFLFNSYIDVGISRAKEEHIKLNLTASYANPKFNSKRIIETSFVDTYSLLLDHLDSTGRIKISKFRKLLENSSFRLWCPFTIEHPLLNLREDFATAFALLAYCLENDIHSSEELKKEAWEWPESLGIGDDGKVANISLIQRDKSKPSLRKITEIFKFCWLLQDITNGSSCFAGLIGVSGPSDCINFKISLNDMENIEPLMKERNPVKFFDMVEKSFTDGAVHVWLDSNESAICSMLLGYTEDKKEKFWGSILTPYFYDDLEKISLSVTPKSTPRGTEKWPWKFEYNKGYFAFFAPKNVMKNIKDELRFMQHTYIHYDSDVFEEWGHLSAKIEQGKQ